ncbi:TniQ family protein [Paraburkholderia sp. CHISQ3]|uniref:TniQ family protein n=1 Tax=Paraburkholderia TaxID=1822464 RepID=UPI00346331D7
MSHLNLCGADMDTRHVSGLPPCRPRMLPDEWVETYLFRVARENGIRRPRLSDIDHFRPTLSATALSKPDGYPIWGDTTLPRWSVVTRVNKIRYCPECMMQSRHIRSRWRLTVLDVCTVHYIRLKDDLAEPVMTRGYGREGRYFVSDVTDEQLWAGAVCPMPGERRYVEQMWSGFERSIVDNNFPGAFEQLTCILALEALLDAVLTTVRDPETRRLCTTRSTELAALVERYQFPLTASLDGIRAFLDHITVVSHRSVVLLRLRRMLIDEAHRPTCFSTLPIVDLRQRLLMGSRKGTSAAHEIPHPDHDQSTGYVSLGKAASLIGGPSRLVKWLIDKGICQGVRVVRVSQRQHTFLPSQAVDACDRWRASVATRKQVMNELHIDGRGFLVLSRTGLLRPVSVDSFKFFRRSDLADLCRRLERVSHPFPSNTAHLHPLLGEWISLSGCYRQVSTDVMNEVFSGKIPIFRRTGSPGLSAYFIDHTALERVRRLRMGEAIRHRHQQCPSGQLSLLTP